MIPIERAVPAMVRIAASSSAAVKSACLVLRFLQADHGLQYQLFEVLGVLEPFEIPAALRNKTAAGGDFITKSE